ncbi:unnamed protein product [Lathyrus oleraceus]
MQTQESGFSLAAAFQRNCSKQLLRSHFQNQAWIPFRSFLLFFRDWASNGSITFDCLASLRSCATSINYLRASEIHAWKSNLPFTTVLTALLNQRDLKRDLKKTHRVEVAANWIVMVVPWKKQMVKPRLEEVENRILT